MLTCVCAAVFPSLGEAIDNEDRYRAAVWLSIIEYRIGAATYALRLD